MPYVRQEIFQRLQAIKNSLPPGRFMPWPATSFTGRRISYIKTVWISRASWDSKPSKPPAASANEILKTQQPCADPYWKLRNKGACEDVFFLTINDKLESLVDAMYGQTEKAGYPGSEMGVYIQPTVQGTGVHCEFNLFYDPANAGEAARVKALSAAAVKGLMAKGAFFSRPYGESARSVINRDAATVAVLKKLKNMFDPKYIMNPGKVCF
jgi:hypothetical protein